MKYVYLSRLFCVILLARDLQKEFVVFVLSILLAKDLWREIVLPI